MTLNIPGVKIGSLRHRTELLRHTEHADDVRIEYLLDGAHFPAEECPQAVAEHPRAFFAPA